jgi:hypothetical protein
VTVEFMRRSFGVASVVTAGISYQIFAASCASYVASASMRSRSSSPTAPIRELRLGFRGELFVKVIGASCEFPLRQRVR